ASRYRVEDKQIDILVRAKESDRASIEDLKNLVVNRQVTNNANPRPNSRNRRERRGSGEEEEDLRPASTTGANGPQAGPQETTRSAPPIRLGAVADIVVGRGPSEVRRIRSQRAAVVSANLTGRDLNSVSNEIQEALGELRRELPPNTNVVLGGQNEELATSYRSLLLALSLAVFLVYLVMASQFESFIHPFIIIFTVPLSAVGVVLALFLTQTTLSIIAFLGVIILAGIVVNNAIVLIDYTNQLRRRGASKRDALLEAGQVRLRPILMTTLTTALGLAPMAVGWGEGSEVRAPMAVTVMGGLLFSTLLTLIFIPVIYELVDRKQYRAEDDEFDEAPGAA
ncbi:MAG: efflux RND transporter permease subunit, partial [bacterium]